MLDDTCVCHHECAYKPLQVHVRNQTTCVTHRCMRVCVYLLLRRYDINESMEELKPANLLIQEVLGPKPRIHHTNTIRYPYGWLKQVESLTK